MKNGKSTFSKAALIISILLTIWFTLTFSPQNILSWDVFGYYLYLPATFIWGDIKLENIEVVQGVLEEYNNSSTLYQLGKTANGSWVNKYSSGMAILYLPFFLIGHAVATWTDYPADGFSAPYQTSILLGSLLYTLLGLVLLRKVLCHFFSDKISAITLLLIVFGTNFFFHTSFHGQNSMSHNYLFTLYAAILLLTIRWHQTKKWKTLLLLAIICGLTILARPSEIVCLFIPLFWGVKDKVSFKEKLQLLWEKRGQIIVFGCLLLFIGFIQFTYWKITTGKFIYYSYGGNAGEGFEFFSPYTKEVLFSFRKGWLIYTPLMVFAILGFIPLFNSKKGVFLPLISYFIFNLYIVSSWSCWWYAESYSQRSLIQSYAVMAIPLGFFIVWLTKAKPWVKIVSTGVALFLLTLNLFQTWQMDKGILHASRMTKAYYQKIFFQTHVDESDKNLLLINRMFEDEEEIPNVSELVKKNLRTLSFDNSGTYPIDSSTVLKNVFKLDSNTTYSPLIEAPYQDITNNYYAWIRTSVKIFPTQDMLKNPTSLVVEFRHNGYAYKWKSLDLENLDLTLNTWNEVSFDYLTPEVRRKSDQIRIYLWHRGKSPVYIDELNVDVYEPKE